MKPLGVTYGEMHSFNDWNLLLKELPNIAPTEPKTLFVDVPGGDGDLDLTESLTGIVRYENREITCTFLSREPKCGWPELYSAIQDFLHGKRMNFKLDNDPGYYYTGRFRVSDWSHDGHFYTVKIIGSVDPYKYEIFSSLDDWLWDDFSFDTGIIREYKDLAVDGTLELTIIGSRKPVRPEFIVVSTDGSGMTLTYNGTDYTLPDGRSMVPAICIGEGEYTLIFTGSGTVSVDYRGGRL